MRPSEPKRVDGLDITKGVLVVFMVLYHSLNYSTQYSLAFRYLSFLPPSFIIITGFLLASVYLARRSASELALYCRLISRGAKLLGLFTALNIAAQVVHSRNYHNPTRGIAYFLQHWIDVYLYGDTRMAVFEILLPIAYLLLLSPALIFIARLHRIAFPAAALPVLVTCGILSWQESSSSTLDLMCAGVLGMWLGRLSFERLTILARWLWLPSVGYVVYAAAALRWGQPFVLQLTAAVLALSVIYGASLHLQRPSRFKQWLVLLGQYSLVAYIAQIGILQILSHFLGRPEPLSLELAGIIIATLALTTATVEVVAWSRNRVPVINGVYRAVFA